MKHLLSNKDFIKVSESHNTDNVDILEIKDIFQDYADEYNLEYGEDGYNPKYGEYYFFEKSNHLLRGNDLITFYVVYPESFKNNISLLEKFEKDMEEFIKRLKDMRYFVLVEKFKGGRRDEFILSIGIDN